MEHLIVGKIVNTHALQGEVKVVSASDFKEERFAKGSQLFIDYKGEQVPVLVAAHREHKGTDLLKFKDLGSINDVEKYKGCHLLVAADELAELADDEFYYFEVIGCQVVTTDGETIGEIYEILETGANDVWIVKRPGQKDALIPYIEDVVKEVDIQEKRVLIQVMEGLL